MENRHVVRAAALVAALVGVTLDLGSTWAAPPSGSSSSACSCSEAPRVRPGPAWPSAP